MKDLTQIFTATHGSTLYGTNTPESDIDLKGVHLPSGRAILLQRVKLQEDVIDSRIKLSTTDKNQAGDVDDQSYAIAKYLHMITQGDTNAIELLFAPEKNIVFQTAVWDEARELGRKSINRKCRGFVGYVQRQVSTYSVKGERLATVQDVVETLHKALLKHGTKAKLSEALWDLEQLVLVHNFCTFQDITSQNVIIEHFVCVDRKMPLSATIKFAHDLMEKVLNEYGDRARRAMQNDNVDWKSVAHAVRIAEEAVELLKDGIITFPRPNAVELLSIKRGERDYDEMGERIQNAVTDVEALSLASKLPEESDMLAIEDFIYRMHLGQVLS